jgi:IS30 family transposase
MTQIDRKFDQQWSEKELQTVKKLKEQGFSNAVISERLGRSTSAIRTILKRAGVISK